MADSAAITAIREAGVAPGDGVRAALAEPEQDSLFAELGAEADRLDELGGRAPAWSGKGRKPGARNRATADIIRFCRARYGDPVMYLGRVASMTVDEVMSEFQLGRSAALDYHYRCLTQYREILYPGRTLADVMADMMSGGGGVQVMGFMALAQAGGQAAGAAPPDIHGGSQAADSAPERSPVNIEENQQLSNSSPGEVNQFEGQPDG